MDKRGRMPQLKVQMAYPKQVTQDLRGLSSERNLLAPNTRKAIALSAGAPILIVAIDTEAEFDWGGPFQRTQTTVENIRNQALAQKIFDDFGVRPVRSEERRVG